MKLFFYKTLFVALIFTITFKITFGALLNDITRNLVNNFSKENVEFLKNKVRSEMNKMSNKEKIINENDAILIKEIIIKLKKELNFN